MSEFIPKKIQRFNTMEEMVNFYHPESYAELLQKADDPLLTSTTGWTNAIYGKYVWDQLSYEANAFGILPKLPWNQTGWRVEKSYPVAIGSWPTGGVAENSAITAEDSIKPDWLELKTDPKTILHHFDSSSLAQFKSTIDDSIPVIPQMRETIGKMHISQINEMLMANVTDLPVNNIESLDRVVSNYDEVTNCSDVDAGDSDIYTIDRDAAAGWSDAVVNHNSNVDRVLTLKIISNTLKDIRQNGGMPNVILTGYDTAEEWDGLLESQRRYLPTSYVKSSFNGVQSTLAGVDGGFAVNTYHGIPIIPTHRCTTGGSGLSHIYFLDTNHIHLKIARPTVYQEADNEILLDRLGMRGAYTTMAELIATRFNCHGKIRDLVAA